MHKEARFPSPSDSPPRMNVTMSQHRAICRRTCCAIGSASLHSQGTVEETTGADLVSGGTTKLKEQLKKLEEGGVLFIDEAYQLDPKMNPIGQQVAMYLGQRGSYVWPFTVAVFYGSLTQLFKHTQPLYWA